MAAKNKLLSINSSDDFFVNSSCIYCGSCWKIDPQHFASSGGNAYVCTQPKGKKEI